VLVERPVPAAWAGRKIGDIEISGVARLAAVSRLGVAQVPKADLVAQEGDVLYVAVLSDRLDEFDASLSPARERG
jgi:trk system potassium uptake protein TrkA